MQLVMGWVILVIDIAMSLIVITKLIHVPKKDTLMRKYANKDDEMFQTKKTKWMPFILWFFINLIYYVYVCWGLQSI